MTTGGQVDTQTNELTAEDLRLVLRAAKYYQRSLKPTKSESEANLYDHVQRVTLKLRRLLREREAYEQDIAQARQTEQVDAEGNAIVNARINGG